DKTLQSIDNHLSQHCIAFPMLHVVRVLAVFLVPAGANNEATGRPFDHGTHEQMWDRQLQVATGQDKENEKREVEREEFGHEGQGVAYTLLGISAFAMMTVYLVHWNDDDVRRYAWEVLSIAISTFTSLFGFRNIQTWLSYMLELEADSGATCVLAYLLFLIWFGLLHAVIGFSAGLLCSNIDESELEFEDWVVEDSLLTADKELVDPDRIVFKRWGRAIATDYDGFPIFCRHRNLAMELIEGRLRSWAVFMSHMTAFAASNAGVKLLHLPFFRDNAACSLLAVVLHLLLEFLLFRTVEILSCRGKPDKMVDVFFDACDDVELDVLGLSASYLLSFVFAFAITGSQSNFEFYQRPSTISLTTAFEIFVIGLAFLALSTALVVMWKGRPNEPMWRTKVRELLQSALALVFSWCTLHAIRWTTVDLCKKHVISLLPASLVVLICCALTTSTVAFAVILPLDKIQDCVRHAGGSGRIFKQVIIALGVIVGVSWEPIFDMAVKVAAHEHAWPEQTRLILSMALVFILLPAWRRFVLSKQLGYAALRTERRSKTFLLKDQDVVMAEPR
ncbi:unnamed protein product, partial [Effrenium voratum]